MRVILALYNLRINLPQLIIALRQHLRQAEQFLVNEEAGRVQVLLDIDEAQHFLERFVLKHDVVVEGARGMFQLVDRIFNHLNGRLELARTVQHRGAQLVERLLLEHDKAVSRHVEYLGQLDLLHLTLLERDKAAHEGRLVDKDAGRDDNYEG